MKLRNKLFAVLGCIGLFISLAASASVPEVDMRTVDVAGLPGQTVMASISLDIDGFNYDAFDFDLTFDPTVLAFQPGLSTFTLNGAVDGLSSLPFYSFSAQFEDSVWHARVSSFSLASPPVSGDLMLMGAFKISDAALPGSYPISINGTVASGPVYEEMPFSGSVMVTVVPEPETWMLWLGGVGLLAWRRIGWAK